MCVQRQLSAVRESREERVGVESRCSVESEPWLCARRAFCTRLGHACVDGDRCSRKAEPSLSFFFIPRVVNRKAMLAALFAC